MIARASSERGAVLVTAVLFMPVLVFLLVFVIDVGNWWTHKRHLQMQADAAALAGGDMFTACFSKNGGPAPNADTTGGIMQTEADKFAGLSTSLYNQQLGGANAGSVSRLYNSKTYPVGGPGPDDTVTGGSCTSQAFDVKESEANLPLFFRVVPGLSSVAAVNTHARVQLFWTQGGAPNLPLAVPDIDPSHVSVTFVNLSNGSQLSGCSGSALVPGTSCAFHLDPQGFQNGFNWWTTSSATISVPGGSSSYSNVGVRVGVGSADGSCANLSNAANNAYTCYDNDGTSPLVTIRGYPSTLPTASPTSPAEGPVWETTSGCGVNAGSPFFSDGSGQSTCTENVQAQVNFGQSPSSIKADVFANGVQMTTSNGNTSGAHIWSANLSYPVGDGKDEPVNLTWQVAKLGSTCTAAKPCTGGFPSPSPDQQAYSADSSGDVTGPVKAVSLSESSSATGSPYSLQAGGHTLSVSVGLETNLGAIAVPPSCQPNPPGCKTTLLRLQLNTSKSITTAVNCDASSNSNAAFVNALKNGCKTPYQINPTDNCNPDPSPPGPADCVPTKNGSLGATVGNALNDRFSPCPPNNWPNIDPTAKPPDPRIIQLLVTDFSNLIGSGATMVPVTNFATFYITGWDGDANSSCTNNEPRPVPGKKNDGDIWGHFMHYSNGSNNIPSNVLCSTPINPAVRPCTPALVR